VAREVIQDDYGIQIMNTEIKTKILYPVCPRCRSAETDILTRSPVRDVWIVYGC
jgi:hypothetical protein